MKKSSYVWWLAGLLVTLQTLYFLFICPQCVISTFRPSGCTKHSKVKVLMWSSKCSNHQQDLQDALTLYLLSELDSLGIC